VTSKLQLTLPKAIADQYGIRPGDEVQWVPAGEVIRVIPRGRRAKVQEALPIAQRLELFDKATERQSKRQETRKPAAKKQDRGWRREDLYNRGRSG
jgi:bifunctional DNA-binding transcriptional regulator/antitoxin component of YhaV-PrlF toxin-antitoxin module